MPKPILGSQVLQDTFEKVQGQGSDVAQGLEDLVSGDSGGGDVKGDGGIEQMAPPAQNPGLTPPQLIEKRQQERRQMEFHRRQVGEWDEHYQQLRKEQAARERQEAEAAEQQREQEIAQLQEAEAKASTLQGPAKPKPGRGTAFLPRHAKQSMGTGELGKSPTS